MGRKAPAIPDLRHLTADRARWLHEHAAICAAVALAGYLINALAPMVDRFDRVAGVVLMLGRFRFARRDLRS